jgi:hypothetical protein
MKPQVRHHALGFEAVQGERRRAAPPLEIAPNADSASLLDDGFAIGK